MKPGADGKGQSPLHRGLTPPIICDSAETDTLRDETLLFNFKPLLFHNTSVLLPTLFLPLLSSQWKDSGKAATVKKILLGDFKSYICDIITL